MVKEMGRLSFVGVADCGYCRLVLGKRGGLVHRLRPFIVGKPVFDPLLQGFADPFEQAFFGFKALLFYQRRVVLPLKSLHHGVPGDVQVLFELVAGHEKICAGGVESRRVFVRRQFADIHCHSEQLPERIAVLALVETAHGDDALGIGKIPACLHHDLCQVLEKIGLCGAGRLLFVVRRHLSGVQGIENLLPALGAQVVRDRKSEGVDAEFPLLLFRVMT